MTPLRPDGPPGMSVGGVHVTGVTLSTSSVVPGDLYVGLPGARTHGARYAAQAVAEGAVALLTDAEGAALAGDLGVPVVVDPDPRGRMARDAAEIYGHPADRLASYGITGTNGKTTTAYILDAALRALGYSTATFGTIGFRLDGEALPVSRTTVTTPESPDLQALLAVVVERGAQALAMEVSSHALAFRRVDGFRFGVTGFTNLGWDHRDFHPTQEDYFLTKAKLFTPEHTGAAVVSTDDAWGVRLAGMVREAGLPLLTTGFDEGPGFAGHVSAQWEPDGAGTHVRLSGALGDLELHLGLPGEHNVRNAMTALAMLALAGQDVRRAAQGLAEVTVPGRMQRVKLGDGAPIVYVDFAHTPEAITATLQAVNHARTIAVLGAGGDRDTAKRGPMGAAAVAAADLVIVTDDNPRSEDPASIRAAVLAGAEQARSSATPGSRAAGCDIIDGGDRRSAIHRALAEAGPGDVVAILGKGHEQGQQVGNDLRPFDDVSVAVQEWPGHTEKETSWT